MLCILLRMRVYGVLLLEYGAGMSVASRREQPQAATYSKRLRDSIKSILDNYGEILKASKVSLHYVPSIGYQPLSSIIQIMCLYVKG